MVAKLSGAQYRAAKFYLYAGLLSNGSKNKEDCMMECFLLLDCMKRKSHHFRYVKILLADFEMLRYRR